MDIHKNFMKNFYFQLAVSEEEKEQAYNVRHRVYCQEFGHSMSGDHERQLERDAYDQNALHCLVKHVASGKAAGCVRVLVPGEPDLTPGGKLPIELNCGSEFFHPTLNPACLSRRLVCEVSRVAIPREFRCPAAQAGTMENYGAGNRTGEMATFSLIGISLYLAATAMIGIIQRRHVFALMEPRLARLLRRSGIRFLQIGNLQNFNGIRAAYYIDQQQAEQDKNPALDELYACIQTAVDQHYLRERRFGGLSA